MEKHIEDRKYKVDECCKQAKKEDDRHPRSRGERKRRVKERIEENRYREEEI